MTSEEARGRTIRAYNAAADRYDDPALSFWERFGRRTVEALRLRPGEIVLDVCCGSGASAIPAAELVAPGGRVLAIDLAENMLELGRAKARSRGLAHIEFRAGDFEEIVASEPSFDAVICVFGIFFVPDMQRAVRGLWSKVGPGGRLAITTWGAGLFEPATTAFWNAVRAERPDLHKGFNPWDRIADGPSLARLLYEGGVTGPIVVEEPAEHPIDAPASWWSILMGSGYRGTIDQLDEAGRARVKEACLRFVADRKLGAVSADIVRAVATRPGAPGSSSR